MTLCGPYVDSSHVTNRIWNREFYMELVTCTDAHCLYFLYLDQPENSVLGVVGISVQPKLC